MNAELKAKWIAALKSGEYEQARQVLRHDERFCCLGVLCEVSGVERSDFGGGYIFGDDEDGNEMWGETELAGHLLAEVGEDNQKACIRMNDGDAETGLEPHSFAQIADWIEQNIPAE